jgi:Kef-type K+ transport system membrane component KefB
MHLHAENLVGVTVAMTLAALFPVFFPRIPVPRVVLEILLGAVMGPQMLGIIHPGTILVGLAQFGLWILFLMAGFEIDLAAVRGPPLRKASLGWVLTAVIAVAVSSLLYIAGAARDPILTALAMSTTAMSVLVPVLRDHALLGPPYGPMIFAIGAIGESAPIAALSLVLAHSYAPEQAMLMLAFAAGAIAVVILATRASSGWFARVVEETISTSGQLPMRLTICVLILLVVLSEKLKIDLVLGAFVAGAVVRAALPRRQHDIFSARLDGLGSAFAVPIFFVAAGARLDVAALVSQPVVWLMVPAYALMMLAARGLPALLLYRAEFSWSKRFALALHSGTQLSLVVAITGIGVQNGLMSGSQGAAMVGGAILTIVLFPALARFFLSEEGSAADGSSNSMEPVALASTLRAKPSGS